MCQDEKKLWRFNTVWNLLYIYDPLASKAPPTLRSGGAVHTLGAILLGLVALPAQDLTWQGAGHFSVGDYRDAIHEDIPHAFGKLVGVFKGCAVANLLRIEQDDVSAQARLDEAAIA